APRHVFTQAVRAPDSIRAFPRGTDFTMGRDTVEVLLQTGTKFVSGAIHYRQGGEQSYQNEALAMDSTLGRPAASIPYSARGVEYWVEVQTLTRRLAFPPDSGASPAIIRTKVEKLPEPETHPGRRYRLLTVPLDFGAESHNLDEVLSNQFGTYDP